MIKEPVFLSINFFYLNVANLHWEFFWLAYCDEMKVMKVKLWQHFAGFHSFWFLSTASSVVTKRGKKRNIHGDHPQLINSKHLW